MNVIHNGSQVTIHYTLSVEGEVVDSSAGREPLKYIQGEHQIIPGLENQLEGLDAGDRKEVTVGPTEGYGEHDPALLQKVPKSAFRTERDPQVGDMVSGTAGERPFQARVAGVTGEDVTLDLNHPLAGKTLYFAIEVVEVR